MRDRFVGIFSASSAASSAGGSGSDAACEELFKEMAMLVPNTARRLQLLSLCPDVSLSR